MKPRANLRIDQVGTQGAPERDRKAFAEMTNPPKPGDRSIVILAMAIVLGAGICNGAASYLKRIGVLDRAAYLEYWAVHCPSQVSSPKATLPVGRPCDIDPIDRDPTQFALERSKAAYHYVDDGYQIGLKGLKDLLTLLFIAVCVRTGTNRASLGPSGPAGWPLWAMCAVAVLGFANSLVEHGGVFAVAGLRPLTYLALALFGGCLAAEMPAIARFPMLLLAFELLLVPFEFLLGMHLQGHFGDFSFARRMSGTFVKPNSLGIFAVGALAFWHAFTADRRHFAPLALLATFLVFASGTATAMIALIVFIWVVSVRGMQSNRAVAIASGAIFLAAMLHAMPFVLGRGDVYDSMFGPGARLDEIRSVIVAASVPELIFGEGIGVGTNFSFNLFAGPNAILMPPLPKAELTGVESTVTSLLKQLGLLGVTAFYVLLFSASVRDRRARFFYMVIAISSLTIKVAEVFPLNFLLGLALAHSFHCKPASPGPETRDAGSKEHGA